MKRSSRVVLGHRNPNSLREDGKVWVLRQSGDYDVLPDDVDQYDHEAIKRHYRVDEVVLAPRLEIATCVATDGPQAGQTMYVTRPTGSQVWGDIGIRDGHYEVIDQLASELTVRFVPTPC